MLFPAFAVAGAVLLMERSACALTVVVAVESLLAGFVSALDDVAVAVLPLASVTVHVTVVAPFANVEGALLV